MRIAVAHADDPRLEEYRHVREAELVQRRGIFVAEGAKIVEVLLGSRFGVRSVLLSDKRSGAVSVPDDIPEYVLPQAQMDRLVGFPIHRGCLAIGERGAELELDALVTPPGVAVVLEGLANHDNIGGIFRAAAGLGARSVLLDPTSADPLYRKAIRVSMGAALTVPFARLEPWPAGLVRLREAGYAIWALTPSAEARPITQLARGEVRPRDRVALLLGSEGDGLSEVALEAADEQWSIPMSPGTDSLNVASAAAVALFALTCAAVGPRGAL